ncbi:MAG: pectate lyase, partial [Chloroflexi bacterium]|nr:pectate lyase [Chloroflexota bacterium]
TAFEKWVGEVEGKGTRAAVGKGASFLMANQLANGGFPAWVPGGGEYGEVDGEAVLALSKVEGDFHGSGESHDTPEHQTHPAEPDND